MKGKELHFDLIDNARDSLHQAVYLLALPELAFPAHDSDTALKHAILNVAHCIELLLKERLRRLHPAFVLENVDQYPSSSARTVTAERALSRLESIAGIIFVDADKKALESCRKMRNAIEHSASVIKQNEPKSDLGRALSFIFTFAHTHLELDLEQEFRADDIWTSLLYQFYEFAQSHAAKLSSQLLDNGCPTDLCPECGYDTLDLFDETCALCGHLWIPDKDSDEDPT
jgi:hypothetical protein